MTTQGTLLKSELRARLPENLPRRLGVAVSGGGDSVALLSLLKHIAQEEQVELFVATVNHNLRPEAVAEADWVAQLAQGLGLPHETLHWQGWDQTGNLQDRARQARYQLLSDWARDKQIGAIALGHTADDQAETMLMRLARAAGVTGLSGMPAMRNYQGIMLLRPMLGVTRQQLRDYLAKIGADWIEDPSNHDRRFDRIKARDALTGLSEIGISAHSLSRVAENLAQAREALEQITQDSARQVLSVDGGDICVDRAQFSTLPAEIRRRLLTGCVRWIAGRGYPPRQAATDRALLAIDQGEAATIGGCLLIPKADKMWICRELNAVESAPGAPGQIWDGRWILSGPAIPDAQVHPLGAAGLKAVPDWRALGKPRAALLASPSVWSGEVLVSAPMVGFSNGWLAELTPEEPEFHSSVLSH
ncbi:tRNA lysidine(34) synthetase TilS [Ruegeria faecimaris]|uniref:tRNA(Ile)-lysidine synthase n=1 Tax=Ruegeria faecimaris TaxID=686389 RepID=A0A521FBR2_9RHOB|nr:tRNA lysidine(34) synthetase TilS [Ruegeria faecimaris]SMO93595.1 tRNA(Ile)-lysidine synthase [Ruegeria faecimaris]